MFTVVSSMHSVGPWILHNSMHLVWIIFCITQFIFFFTCFHSQINLLHEETSSLCQLSNAQVLYIIFSCLAFRRTLLITWFYKHLDSPWPPCLLLARFQILLEKGHASVISLKTFIPCKVEEFEDSIKYVFHTYYHSLAKKIVNLSTLQKILSKSLVFRYNQIL